MKVEHVEHKGSNLKIKHMASQSSKVKIKHLKQKKSNLKIYAHSQKLDGIVEMMIDIINKFTMKSSSNFCTFVGSNN